MAKTQGTPVALGTIASAAAATAVNVGASAAALTPTSTVDRTLPVVLVVSTGVTTGATLVIQARNRQGNPTGDVATAYREVARVAVTANGSKLYPLEAGDLSAHYPDDLRVSAAVADGGAYTDGSHVCTLLLHS